MTISKMTFGFDTAFSKKPPKPTSNAFLPQSHNFSKSDVFAPRFSAIKTIGQLKAEASKLKENNTNLNTQNKVAAVLADTWKKHSLENGKPVTYTNILEILNAKSYGVGEAVPDDTSVLAKTLASSKG
jgi:hypothetical protein